MAKLSMAGFSAQTRSKDQNAGLGNLQVQVEQYHIDGTVAGVDLKSGERIRVGLLTAEGAAKLLPGTGTVEERVARWEAALADRIPISAFNDPGFGGYTAAGGVLTFANVQRDGDGSLFARDVKAFARHPERDAFLRGYVEPVAFEDPAGRDLTFNVLQPHLAFDLAHRAALEALFSQEQPLGYVVKQAIVTIDTDQGLSNYLIGGAVRDEQSGYLRAGTDLEEVLTRQSITDGRRVLAFAAIAGIAGVAFNRLRLDGEAKGQAAFAGTVHELAASGQLDGAVTPGFRAKGFSNVQSWLLEKSHDRYLGHGFMAGAVAITHKTRSGEMMESPRVSGFVTDEVVAKSGASQGKRFFEVGNIGFEQLHGTNMAQSQEAKHKAAANTGPELDYAEFRP